MEDIEPFVVRRSAWRMWVMALAGIPLLVVAVDVLTQRRITDALRDFLFRPEDTQLLEPRDVIWAWALLLVGGALTLWGLKELILPTPVVRADADGLALKVSGPFRRATLLPWDQVDDVGSATVDDEGSHVQVMWVRLMEPGPLPDDPWGARWVDERTIAILAGDWEIGPTEAAKRVTETAVAAAQAERMEAG